MSTSTIQSNILYGIGEGGNVSNSTYLSYALRWANAAYREIFLRYRFKTLRTRAIFRTANGQQSYQSPADLIGFLTLKDESNDTIIDQVTNEEFAREVSVQKVSDETFTSSFGVAVSLDNQGIAQYSETVTDDTVPTNTYVRDTDYTMDYTSGTITVLATGSIADATTTYISYLHYQTGKPTKFCLEYDATNEKYVFRFDKTPDAEYVASVLYSATPVALSSTVDPVWSSFEFALERGGIYYGSLEITQDVQLRAEYKSIYETALMALIRLDSDLIPKHNTIPIRMRKTEYAN